MIRKDEKEGKNGGGGGQAWEEMGGEEPGSQGSAQ